MVHSEEEEEEGRGKGPSNGKTLGEESRCRRAEEPDEPEDPEESRRLAGSRVTEQGALSGGLKAWPSGGKLEGGVEKLLERWSSGSEDRGSSRELSDVKLSHLQGNTRTQ